jgi:20S proteasome subunit alpha 6
MNANRNRPPGQQNNRGNFPNNQNRRNILGGNQGGGSFRNQQRQNNLGNRDHNNNRSFNAGQQQQGRGRNNQRSGRNDGSFIAHGSGSGVKKDEVKRAMTDFKLVGIEIKQLGWSWGVIPSPQKADLAVEPNRESPGPIKAEADERVLSDKVSTQPSTGQDDPNVDMKAEPSEVYSLPTKPDLGLPPVPHTLDGPAVPSPPSRVRIYFHTPVTPKDSMPIPHASAVPVDLSALATSQGSPRKGKRKRADDEEDDGVENCTSHPSAAHQDDAVSVTAHPDQDGFGGSAAPSVAESTSEGDWLMAAIGEDSNEGDGPDASRHPPHDSHMANGKLDVFSSSRSRGRG